MNNLNIRTWQDSGRLRAEWGDCALDDDERSEGILIEVYVNLSDYPNEDDARKALKTKITAAYDQWIRDTRGN